MTEMAEEAVQPVLHRLIGGLYARFRYHFQGLADDLTQAGQIIRAHAGVEAIGIVTAES